MDQLTALPATFTAGDTFDLLVSETDYPASSGWSITFALRGGGDAINLSSTPSGDAHLFQKSATLTADWTPGIYRAYKRAVHATIGTYSLGYTTIQILANPTDLTASADVRSHARKVLDSIEAVIEGRANTDQLEQEIDTGNGRRRLKRCSIDELLKLQAIYASRVLAEEEKLAGGSTGGRYLMGL